MGPLDDAIQVLQLLKQKYPEMNGSLCNFGRLELTFKDGVVYSVGPMPYLVRGKDFHVETKRIDNRP